MTRIIGEVISNNPDSPGTAAFESRAIQIMKHNGDNDTSPKPCFLPDRTAAHSPQPASTRPPPLPFTDEPHVPISSLWGRARTELLGWIFSFHWAFFFFFFCHKKNLSYFQQILERHSLLSLAASSHGPPYVKRVSREEGYGFPYLGFRALSQTAKKKLFIHTGSLEMMRSWHFPSMALLQRIWGGIVRASHLPQPRSYEWHIWRPRIITNHHISLFLRFFRRSGVNNMMKQGARWPTKWARLFTIMLIWTRVQRCRIPEKSHVNAC